MAQNASTDDLVAMLGETEGLAVEVGKCEVGRGVAEKVAGFGVGGFDGGLFRGDSGIGREEQESER